MSADLDGLQSNMTQAMRLVQTLDPRASLRFSVYTQQWYVEASIDVSNGAVLTGGTEHRGSPWEALTAYVNTLKEIDQRVTDRVIVAKPTGERRHYRWNGSGFVEEALDLIKVGQS